MSPTTARIRATAALNLAGRLDHLVRTARIYPDGHVALIHTLRSCVELAEAVRGEQTSIDWSVVQDRVVVGNRVARPSPGLRGAVRELGEFLTARGLGGLCLHEGLDEEQLMAVVRVLLAVDATASLPAVSRELAQAGVQTVEALPPRTLHGAEDTGGEADPAVAALRIYLRGLRCVRGMRSRGLSPAVMVEIQRVAQGIVDLWTTSPRRALSLAVPRQLLPRDLLHPVHTAVVSVSLGYALGMDDGLLEELAVAALVASVGLELDPAELEDVDEEVALAREQAAWAAAPLRSFHQLVRLAALDTAQLRRLRVAVEQRRHFDGSGPAPLPGSPSPHLFSRIVHLAAHYDELRADTDWRDGLSVRGALQALQQEAGVRHDPSLVAILAEYQSELEVADAGI
jgi:hypothetical protein